MADVVASKDGSSAGEGPAAGFSAVVYTDIDGSTGLWERHPDLMPAALERHNRLIESTVDTDFSPDGSLIAIGGEATNLVVVADTSTGEERYRITDHQGDVTDLQFSEDGSLLLTASSDGTIRLWDAPSGESVLTVPLDTTGYIFAQFDQRNPEHIVFAREDGLMGILTTNTDELLDIARSRVQRDFTPAECERFSLDACDGSA